MKPNNFEGSLEPLTPELLTTEVQTDPISQIGGWVILMKDGGYAVVIFLLVIFMFFRKDASTFFKEHLELLRSVKDVNNKNAEALGKTTEALRRLTRTNTRLTEILTRHFKIPIEGFSDSDDVEDF